MRIAMVVAVMLGGCSHIQQAQTYPPPTFYPLEAEFDLQPAKTEQQCTAEDNNSNRSTTKWAIGPGFLYELIKQKIASGFDGALITSSVMQYGDNQVCLSLTGRPYRLSHVRAVAGAHQPEVKSGGILAPNFGGE